MIGTSRFLLSTRGHPRPRWFHPRNVPIGQTPTRPKLSLVGSRDWPHIAARDDARHADNGLIIPTMTADSRAFAFSQLLGTDRLTSPKRARDTKIPPQAAELPASMRTDDKRQNAVPVSDPSQQKGICHAHPIPTSIECTGILDQRANQTRHQSRIAYSMESGIRRLGTVRP